MNKTHIIKLSPIDTVFTSSDDDLTDLHMTELIENSKKVLKNLINHSNENYNKIENLENIKNLENVDNSKNPINYDLMIHLENFIFINIYNLNYYIKYTDDFTIILINNKNLKIIEPLIKNKLEILCKITEILDENNFEDFVMLSDFILKHPLIFKESKDEINLENNNLIDFLKKYILMESYEEKHHKDTQKMKQKEIQKKYEAEQEKKMFLEEIGRKINQPLSNLGLSSKNTEKIENKKIIKPKISKISEIIVKENFKILIDNLHKKNINFEDIGKINLFITKNDKDLFQNGINFELNNKLNEENKNFMKISYSPKLINDFVEENVFKGTDAFPIEKNLPLAKFSIIQKNNKINITKDLEKLINFELKLESENFENWESDSSSNENNFNNKSENIFDDSNSEKKSVTLSINFENNAIKKCDIEFNNIVNIISPNDDINISNNNDKTFYNNASVDSKMLVICGITKNVEKMFPMKFKCYFNKNFVINLKSEDIDINEKSYIEIIVNNF